MVKRHHPLSRAERLELKDKFETPKNRSTKSSKKPRSVRGVIKDTIKDEETQDELFEYIKQRDING